MSYFGGPRDNRLMPRSPFGGSDFGRRTEPEVDWGDTDSDEPVRIEYQIDDEDVMPPPSTGSYAEEVLRRFRANKTPKVDEGDASELVPHNPLIPVRVGVGIAIALAIAFTYAEKDE